MKTVVILTGEVSVPSVVACGVLVSVCAKSREPERSLQVFDQMQREGIVPNLVTYNALISACEKSGASERAL